MKKRTFEDYQKLALILRAVDQMLFESAQLYNRAAYSDETLRIDRKLQRMKSQAEEELFKDYPEQANISIFYGSEARQLNIEYGTDFIHVKLTRKE